MKFPLLLVIGIIILAANIIYGRVLPKNIQKRDDLHSGSSSDDSFLDNIRRPLDQPFDDEDDNHQFIIEDIEPIQHDQPHVVNQLFDPNENWFLDEYGRQEQHNQQEDHNENIDELLNSQHQQNHNLNFEQFERHDSDRLSYFPNNPNNENNENSDHHNRYQNLNSPQPSFENWIQYLQNLHDEEENLPFGYWNQFQRHQSEDNELNQHQHNHNLHLPSPERHENVDQLNMDGEDLGQHHNQMHNFMEDYYNNRFNNELNRFQQHINQNQYEDVDQYFAFGNQEEHKNNEEEQNDIEENVNQLNANQHSQHDEAENEEVHNSWENFLQNMEGEDLGQHHSQMHNFIEDYYENRFNNELNQFQQHINQNQYEDVDQYFAFGNQEEHKSNDEQQSDIEERDHSEE